jgi:hypothetical protein
MSFSAACKAQPHFQVFAARLKSYPVTKPSKIQEDMSFSAARGAHNLNRGLPDFQSEIPIIADQFEVVAI